MPAYPTHTFFSQLCLLALLEEGHFWAPLVEKHAALFRIAGIAGADVQCMPYQICSNCRAPYRHDQGSKKKCLICAEETLADFKFRTEDGRELDRRYIEQHLYGNTHLVLYRKYQGYGVPPDEIRKGSLPDQPFPDQVVEHLANCFRDTRKIGGRHEENYIAFTLGWFSHVVSDALFKGVYQNAVRISFFGHQYNMAMLPAAESLTVTDLAHDFGVSWVQWHRELLQPQNYGGALKHLSMGNSAELYAGDYWTEKFGRPDPSIGAVMEAVPEINRKWFHAMYVQPDYSAPTPALDRLPWSLRATGHFGESNLNLGQLRRYAKGTGWYEAFVKGVQIYLRIVKEGSGRAGIPGAAEAWRPQPGTPSFRLWSRIAAPAQCSTGLWGSELRIDPEVKNWLIIAQREGYSIDEPAEPTDYQKRIALALLEKFPPAKNKKNSRRRVVIGSPFYNSKASGLICTEDSLRLKYDAGLAGIIALFDDKLLMAGFSDFGDVKLADWLRSTV